MVVCAAADMICGVDSTPHSLLPCPQAARNVMGWGTARTIDVDKSSAIGVDKSRNTSSLAWDCCGPMGNPGWAGLG